MPASLRRVVNLNPYRDHLLHGTGLNAAQRKMLDWYRRAFALQCNGYSQAQTATILKKESADKGKELSESHLLKIVRESLLLYGDVRSSDKAGLRFVMYENAMSLSAMARKAGDMGSAVRALDMAAKILGIYEQDVQGFNPADFMVKRTLQFTDELAALKAQEGIIDITPAPEPVLVRKEEAA